MCAEGGFTVQEEVVCVCLCGNGCAGMMMMTGVPPQAEVFWRGKMVGNESSVRLFGPGAKTAAPG